MKSVNSIRAEQSELTKDLRGKLSSLQSTIGEYRSEHGKLQSFFDDVTMAIDAYVPNKQVYTPSPSKARVTTPCSVVAQACDWHMGAVQPRAEIEGFNEFSPEICRQRVYEFAKKLIDWTEVHRAAYHIDELVLLVLGDLISGDIHDELRVTAEFPAPVQCVEAGGLLAEFVSMLAPHFANVRVEFVVEDNHGRLTKKPQAREAGLNTFNYLVGHIAKLHLAKTDNVQFNIYPQYEAVVQVAGRKYLLCHGHGVSGWMGFPYYGIERKVAKEAMKRMNGPDANRFNRVILGHWHAPMTHPIFWIGGSVSGTDAYDHKCGRASPPSQASWIVHPKYSEFDRVDWDLR